MSIRRPGRSTSPGKTGLPDTRRLFALAPLLLIGATPRDDCAALADARSQALDITSAVREGNVCHVEAIARPRPGAAIGFSLWLPPPARWSGRYYQMGNGGFAGSIDRKTLAAAAARGDAAAATDTGHTGTGFDAGWARNRPDLVSDYAWRSIKVTSDAARGLVGGYYGRPPRRRYFMGCSFGGRQALVAASRWPGDWDGIISGAPAVEWIDWLAAFARIQFQLRKSPAAWIDAGRMPELVALTQRGRSLAGVLNTEQRRSLSAIASAGYAPTDADPLEWRTWILNRDPTVPSQARFAVEAQRYLFADRPEWQLADYPDRRPSLALLKDTFWVGSLNPFLARGGKVLAYVGTADAVLPPRKIIAALDQRATGRPRRAGYRLLAVPGMAHCQGGSAPDGFGQSVAAPAGRDDPRDDVRRALEAWVEQARPPVSMTLTRTRDGAQRQLGWSY